MAQPDVLLVFESALKAGIEPRAMFQISRTITVCRANLDLASVVVKSQ